VRSLAGDEVLPRLRTHPETTDIPVVDLSTDAKPSQKTHTYCRQAHRRS
jgi:CheY-like chemotaxis protein